MPTPETKNSFITSISAAVGGAKGRFVQKVIAVLLTANLFLLGAFFPDSVADLGRSNYFKISSIILLLIVVVIGLFREYNRLLVREKLELVRVQRAELRVQEHPDQPQAAWELAQVKLETYLNRNLGQVRSIYWLTVLIMIIGFVLIGIGVYKVYHDPGHLEPSVLTAISGVLVNFIGASFLIVYRSTMAQAKEYVMILERINAVGMSVQILGSIEDEDGNLKSKTTAEVAVQLLKMYGSAATDNK